MSKLSETQERNARECLDAIRLAVEAAADERAALMVIRTILADAPSPKRAETRSVARLLRAVKRTRRARFIVPPRAPDSHSVPRP